MTRRALRILQAASLVLLFPVAPVLAGPYADDLTKCLVSSTTTKDKTDLVRWIFASASAHPDVKSLAAVTDEERTELTQTVGHLIERLLTDSCRKEYRDAVKFEGDETLGISFGVLGQVAMKGLMEDPAVSKQFAELGKVVDQEKLKAALQPDEP